MKKMPEPTTRLLWSLVHCEACVFNDVCLSGSTGKALNYPVKIANKKTTTRYFEYFVINNNGNTYTQQRTESDIWKNLHQFPLLEYAEKTDETVVLAKMKKEILKTKVNNFEIIRQTGYKKHQLSHQTIFARFTYLNVKKFNNSTYKQIALKQLKKLPFPILIANEISTLKTQ
jgi:A/G-specific adenine glycosylase